MIKLKVWEHFVSNWPTLILLGSKFCHKAFCFPTYEYLIYRLINIFMRPLLDHRLNSKGTEGIANRQLVTIEHFLNYQQHKFGISANHSFLYLIYQKYYFLLVTMYWNNIKGGGDFNWKAKRSTSPIQEKCDPEANEDPVFNFQIVGLERWVDGLESGRVFWQTNCGDTN